MPPSKTDDAAFYKFSQSKVLRIAALLSARIRERVVRRFISISRSTPLDTILDVGVTSEQQNLESNFFERQYPHKHKIIATGLADASYLVRTYPGVRFFRSDGKHLPLQSSSVDHVFTHAVIEHVGNRQEQHRFILELLRVARKGVFITTPNRWFPMEVHVFLPFLHYLPPVLFRKILTRLGKQPFDSEDFLNLLSRRDLIRLCQQDTLERFQIHRQRLFGFTSNLLLYIEK